jgi:hypothetical protein
MNYTVAGVCLDPPLREVFGVRANERDRIRGSEQVAQLSDGHREDV